MGTRVVLAADGAYLDFVRCSLHQIAAHGRAASGVTLLTPAGVDPDGLRTVQESAERLHVDLDVVCLDAFDDFVSDSKVQSRGHVSAFTYAKLLMAEALPNLDQVLYLDVDTLVRDDLTPLLEYRLQHPLGAVRELGGNGARIFGDTRVPYFNAGVLRMSLHGLRESGMTRRSTEILRKRPRLQFQDQDVLNLMFRDGHDALPHAYNMFDSLASLSLPAWAMIDDPVIVHFVGPAKPWHSDTSSRFAVEWRTVHAAAMGLSPEATRDYEQISPETWQERVHAQIVRARFSAPGQAVRSALPVSVKDAMNRAILAAIPRRTALAHEVLEAMNEAHAEPGAQEPDALQVSGLRGADQPDSEAPSAVELSSGAATETQVPFPIPSSPSTREGSHALPEEPATSPLIVVASVPRSGTNALNSVLRESLRDVRIEGEFYNGHVTASARKLLESSKPWLAAAAIDDGRDLSREEVLRREAEFRRGLAGCVAETTGALVASHTGPTVIKVFPSHLDPAGLESVLTTFRPRMIILRRLMVFSYVSFLKARASGAWFGRDTTDIAVHLREEEVRDYVRRCDEWFDAVTELCVSLDLPTLDITYDELFEGPSPYPVLRDFLPDLKFRGSVEKTGQVVAKTVRQERRSDASVAALIAEMGALSPSLRSDLLRYPGLVKPNG